MRRALMLAAFAVPLVGCATTIRVPTDHIAQTEAAIQAAESAGAATKGVPAANSALDKARFQFAEAKKEIKAGEAERAEFLLVRARVDAELAEALASQAAQKDAASEARKELERINAELTTYREEAAKARSQGLTVPSPQLQEDQTDSSKTTETTGSSGSSDVEADDTDDDTTDDVADDDKYDDKSDDADEEGEE
jgi:hypothetical protein